jgi:hypothetical protein
MNAEQLVFSNGKDGGIANLVAKYKDYKVRVRHFHMPTKGEEGYYQGIEWYVGKS